MSDKTAAAARLVDALMKHKMSIATAESCTGGGIGQAITSVSGSSAVYGYGVVSYSNEAKMRLLQVPAATLETHGAVSEETARAMLLGIMALSGADMALAVTGIAGPGGGSAEKPVGLVYIGCCVGHAALVERHLFDGSREEVREQTVLSALRLALRCLGEK